MKASQRREKSFPLLSAGPLKPAMGALTHTPLASRNQSQLQQQRRQLYSARALDAASKKCSLHENAVQCNKLAPSEDPLRLEQGGRASFAVALAMVATFSSSLSSCSSPSPPLACRPDSPLASSCQFRAQRRLQEGRAKLDSPA